jgi:phytanoyl-CoA hydroxylase
MYVGEGSRMFSPHQDYPYNRGSDNSIVVWIPLQDTDIKNGCLKYSPHSHEGGFIKGITSKTDRLEGMILSSDYEWEDAPMLAGEVLLFSMFLVHKSGTNSTKDSIRFTVQVRYNDLADNNFAERGFKPLEEF